MTALMDVLATSLPAEDLAFMLRIAAGYGQIDCVRSLLGHRASVKLVTTQLAAGSAMHEAIVAGCGRAVLDVSCELPPAVVLLFIVNVSTQSRNEQANGLATPTHQMM